ncbi:multi antimicrobial extrusion protein MatE [Paenibacillus oenotherae]|uniref:Multi antimicrobial extrusion protein MatE n=1 Tax=Paenibacillus oenotherae TaxID=1435645 RepID=A0ABS7D874_9BACL|nr:multi antimicrobial extrusion protein MatE [Paenibacillus oenotherae]MBW7476122.1 multi antimicrobial extrusion protein MatE [Paenibacillus oenotherae]
MNQQSGTVSMKQLWRFFLPLGISASLVTISHVIINSTLSQGEHPEQILASYAIAMSLLVITERPALLLRQTSSVLVRDKRSFRAMLQVSQLIFFAIMALGFLICYTPLGNFIFSGLFGLEHSLVPDVIDVYRVLMFVSLFSGIRCLYQGIIIYNLRTRWLTIGMIVRLIGMYLLSLYFIHSGVKDATVGAYIFLAGMIIEAAMSYGEGRLLVRRMPDVVPEHEIVKPRQVFSFYRPLLLSTFVAVWIGPVINAMLGKTTEVALAIASFALAGSIVQLVVSFFTYFHQIVLNFYKIDREAVRRFTLLFGFIPALLVSMLAFTPIGEYFVGTIMGVDGKLAIETLKALKPFVLLALIMPWLDVFNGIIMVRGHTRVMLGSQISNLSFTALALLLLVLVTPGWNGTIGAWAQSLGLAAECGFVAYAIRRGNRINRIIAGKVTDME